MFITIITLAVNNDDGSNWVITCLRFNYAIWLVLSSTCHFLSDNSLQSANIYQQEMRAVAEKPHGAVVKFATYRNLQRHRVALPPAIARLSCPTRQFYSESVNTYREYCVLIDNKYAKYAEADWLSVQTIHEQVQLTKIKTCKITNIYSLKHCFSTGVSRNLSILPVVSKGSMGWPPVLSKKINCVRHLWPLGAFSRLLVGPKCICGLPRPKDMGSVNNQNCCKGFRFTENVEKHRLKVLNILATLQNTTKQDILTFPIFSFMQSKTRIEN